MLGLLCQWVALPGSQALPLAPIGESATQSIGSPLTADAKPVGADGIAAQAQVIRKQLELRSQCKLPPAGQAIKSPSAAITGVGDSGTRGVVQLLEAVGLRFSELRTPSTGDNTCTKDAQRAISNLTRCSGGVISASAYHGQACTEAFAIAKELEADGVAMTWESIKHNQDAWGFKNPRHLYLQPVLQDLYGNQTLAVLVARDPRDICTGDNQHQYDTYLTESIDAQDGLPSSGSILSCYEWWAHTWTGVLEGDGAMERTVVVRIEDLVLPSLDTSLGVLGCVTKQIWGLGAYGRDVARDALIYSHSFNASYGGGKLALKEKLKTESEFAAVANGSPELTRISRALGYRIEAYGVSGDSAERSSLLCAPLD